MRGTKRSTGRRRRLRDLSVDRGGSASVTYVASMRMQCSGGRAAVIALRDDSGVDDDEVRGPLGACVRNCCMTSCRARLISSPTTRRVPGALVSEQLPGSQFDLLRVNDLLRAHETPGAARLLAAVESVRVGATPPDELDRGFAAVSKRSVRGYAACD